MTGEWDKHSDKGRSYSLPLSCCWERARPEETETYQTQTDSNVILREFDAPLRKSEALCPLKCFGSVCICWLHCSRIWFECSFSSAVQPSEQWISSSGHREIGGRGGKAWNKSMGSLSFPFLLGVDERARDRWIQSSGFQRGTWCSVGEIEADQ